MAQIKYFDGQRIRTVNFQDAYEARQLAHRGWGDSMYAVTPVFAPIRPQAAGAALVGSLLEEEDRLETRFQMLRGSQILVEPVDAGATTVIPTETVAIDSPRKSDVQFLKNRYGLVTVEEGSQGKVLMRVPDDADDPVQYAAEAALALHDRGGPSAAHPNFLRVLQRTPRPATEPGAQWALDNPGEPGLIGADVSARAAWTVTNGNAEIRVAVLDEGVDTKHPFLAAAVVAEKDFVNGNTNAMPDGDDAHGTACAGIIASRGADLSGLAPEVSLVAARIAKSQGKGLWVFDDFQTADAIDWCWSTAQADVLSNSWGGGPPVPVITRAFERARTNGRGGRGAVIVAATGNSQTAVSYPANLKEVFGVGASNQWDKRKTRSSKDGEYWWGSNFGRGLNLLAPGVAIATTDISDSRGYSSMPTTGSFNGTSSATPFVAAAAALMLSVNPALLEFRVRELLQQTADAVTSSRGWNRYTGFGRLNAYMAIRAARRA